MLSQYLKYSIIFISNFDIANSELELSLDFSQYMKVSFPHYEEHDLKELITSELEVDNYDQDKLNATLSLTVGSFIYSFANLGEYNYCFKENLLRYCSKDDVNSITDTMLNLSISEDL